MSPVYVDEHGDVSLHDNITHSGEVPLSGLSIVYSQTQVCCWKIFLRKIFYNLRSQLSTLALAIPGVLFSLVFTSPNYFILNTAGEDIIDTLNETLDNDTMILDNDTIAVSQIIQTVQTLEY